MKIRSILNLSLLLGVMGLSWSHDSQAQDNQKKPSLSLDSCFVDGVKTQLKCGSLTVPEDWTKPQGATLGVHVIVVNAISTTPKKDPLFLLMGGPGQASSELTGMLIKIFRETRENRDLVLIDQRGTGKSNPLLCEDSQANPYSDVFADFDVSDVNKCLESYDHDLAQYNTNNAVLDFEAVREALGYEQINLYGISYGSRAAMVYMREKPQALRSVILDGVVPPQIAVGPMGAEAARSFDLLIEQCHQEDKCRQKYPNLRQDYLTVRSELEQQTIETVIDHPVTDKPVTLKVDTAKFIGTLHSLMYSTGQRELIPFVIEQFALKNYKPLSGLIAASQEPQSKIYTGLHFNIICNEDIPRADAALLAKDKENSFSGQHSMSGLNMVCQHWPKFDAPANFGDQVVSDIPTLLLSGELDPVTPPAWADLAAKGLSVHKHYVAKKAGHGLVTQTCAGKMIAQYIDKVSFDDIDDSCLDEQPVPGFLMNNNGNW
ncbi:alpha/beta hydrolase [Psychrobium sp. 1_MG-2023]|uniref:alpha/beta hydrolase n=1 Tax=Psychrobium sp. 1_MG-2023 TaxID=3062624 RepID=UPI000C332CFC|nr:alpha/beta hydrolase [Psychrobium sp. 1_MG-2023]MDP2559783.1 alpha/beta hydrolase [Psychrobium sp. 1_MG-2023]PKF59109.1 alpha/beta hydrolase [Alteromonadales bacterium alter-6D02]